MRICRRCGQPKPLTTEFFTKHAASPAGLLSTCKLCKQVAEAADRAVRVVVDPAVVAAREFELLGGVKTCKICGGTKPADETHFYRRKEGRLQPRCRVCWSERARARHAGEPLAATPQSRAAAIRIAAPRAHKAESTEITCSTCRQTFSATDEHFYRRGNGKLHRQCRECMKMAVRISSKTAYAAGALLREAKLVELPETATVACQVCGRHFFHISSTHLVQHDMTLEVYAARFPGAPLQSGLSKRQATEAHGYDADFRQKRRDHMQAHWRSDNPAIAEHRMKLDAHAPTAVLESQEAAGIPTWRTTEVPERLHGAILGMVLGDSGLAGRWSLERHAHLTLGHCESQVEYLKIKMALLGPLVQAEINGPYRHAKKPAKPFYRTWTISHPHFSMLHDAVYRDGQKRVLTTETLEPLDALGLALLYLDDGWRNVSNGSISFATNSFDIESIDVLAGFLAERFGLKLTKNRQGVGFTLRLSSRSHDRFFSLIRPFVPACMVYKLGSA